MIVTVMCPKCGHEQEVDDDNDVVTCDKCERMFDYDERDYLGEEK